MKVRNTFIIFLVSGFWHGANWTFIVWGALNAFYFLPLLLTKNNRNFIHIVAQGRLLPTLKELLLMLFTCGLTIFAWIFFRAENIKHAFQFIGDMFKYPGSFLHFGIYLRYKMILILIVIFIIIEWLGREEQYALAQIGLKWNPIYRYSFYYAIIIAIFWFGGNDQQFIYFQF
jgi:D-alanyl-lipoteichoic acid acyltransferase DltB (MBOAT superfamily)